MSFQFDDLQSIFAPDFPMIVPSNVTFTSKQRTIRPVNQDQAGQGRFTACAVN